MNDGKIERFGSTLYIIAIITGILYFLFFSAGTHAMAGEEGCYPNTTAKDMDADMPWRVETADTSIPVIWVIKDSDILLAEIDEMKYVVLYDVSDGYDPPGDLDSPLSDHVVYYHDFGDMVISQYYWYWLTATFENDGSYHGTQPNGTPLTPANLGYTEGDTISFTLRLYGKDGVWPFYTDVTLDQDFKVHVGEEMLPAIPGWYWGDVHDHGWKTDNIYEYGEPTEGKTLAAAAMGLSFVTVTDHSSDLTTSEWGELDTECGLYSTSMCRLVRAEEIHANEGTLLDIRHILGYGLSTYIEGAETGTYSINDVLGGPTPGNNIAAQGGFAYAAHPTDPMLGWTYAELENALNYPVFMGLQVFNQRIAYLSGDGFGDGDEYHPWGGDDSIDPYNHDWTLRNAAWDDGLNQGVKYWDRLLAGGLNPVRKIFMSGGSDAHGGWNYNNYMNDSLVLIADSSAMGKVRTAVHIDGILSDNGILNSLKSGRSIVSDGPAMIFGIDTDGDASLTSPGDVLIGEGPVTMTPDNTIARFHFVWKSSAEYGDVVCIRLYRGEKTTGDSPDVVFEHHPYNFNGEVTGITVASILPAAGETIYTRAVAYTYDPAGPDPHAGDVSNFTYDTASHDYKYRCFTNPVWVTAGAPIPVMYPAGFVALIILGGLMLWLTRQNDQIPSQ